MKTVLITFQPFSRYFFGDHHGFDDVYKVVSKKIPALSTVIGTIRHELLLQKGLIQYMDGKELVDPIHEDKLKQLIGEFLYDREPMGKLGCIESISPVMLAKVDSADPVLYYPLPMNIQKKPKKENDKPTLQYCPVALEEKGQNNFSGNIREVRRYLKGYDYKSGYTRIWADLTQWEQLLRNINGTQTAYLEDEAIFCSNDVVGIRRDREFQANQYVYKSKEDDKGFFLKTDYRFTSDTFRFAVLLDVQDNFDLQNASVLMGGEQTSFRMEIQEWTVSENNRLEKALLNPMHTLCAGRTYCVLSETNFDNLSELGWVFNAGAIERTRRLVFKNNRDDNHQLDRFKIKGAVCRYLPIGSIIIPDKDIQIKPTYNQQVGYDRFIEIPEEKC